MSGYIYSVGADGNPKAASAQDPLPTQLTGSNLEKYGKSTDTKPTVNIIVGTTFFEIDTKTVYMWDGSTWVVI